MPPSFLRLAPLAVACIAIFSPVRGAEIEHGLHAAAQRAGSVDSLIVLAAKAPRQLLRTDGDYLERRRNLVETLRATSEVTQAALREWLDAQGIAYRPFWIVNMIEASLTPVQLDALAARDDIAGIKSNRVFKLIQARPQPAPDGQPEVGAVEAPLGIEWGVNKVRAPLVWATGIRGQNVVVASQDTGVRWDHPALKAKYRGWNGTTADHNYNWHDAIHTSGSACGANAIVPCDDYASSHGTHTVGTMVGDDGAGNQVGVAPDAQWIGCRNMNNGDGTPATYIECTQWMMAPTDLANLTPNSDLAPDVVNNSWTCLASEGCTSGEEIRQAIENLVEAGIFFVAAAGNSGPSCNTITNPPAIYDAVFTVGGTDSTDSMYIGSGRGGAVGPGSIKPDVIAPGQSVRSSIRNSPDTPGQFYGSLTGTSMASPHVAGAAALLMSANPGLKGSPARLAEILRQTAVPLTSVTQVCGGIPATSFPNYVQGYGQIDVHAAFLLAERIFVDGFDD